MQNETQLPRPSFSPPTSPAELNELIAFGDDQASAGIRRWLEQRGSGKLLHFPSRTTKREEQAQ